MSIAGIIAPQVKEKKPHIKKPLNAFMLFMKEKRADVIKECTLKESAAINQILGKMVRERGGGGGRERDFNFVTLSPSVASA